MERGKLVVSPSCRNSSSESNVMAAFDVIYGRSRVKRVINAGGVPKFGRFSSIIAVNAGAQVRRGPPVWRLPKIHEIRQVVRSTVLFVIGDP